ncbi:hypothetical protein LX16_3356 [Stackebrandtia albiflava]|uniref:Uncharacterized protein n=1 Tax=Stackebrandtia albiflava TaxID=406432 RepID=A0A562V417_9ACTN|nr:hypothetical protein [Stackebrandtia albiflava]TWJ12595.1 hypothetical protein LX16_3356 [Stackebrandtia albiflava]
MTGYQMTDTSLIPLPEPGEPRRRLAEARLELARTALRDGGRDAAAAVLEDSLRAGLWRHVELWRELAELPDDPADRERIGQLWLDSPKSCHQMPTAVAVLARAAAVAGRHEEARLLLRKAILLCGVRRSRFRRGTTYEPSQVVPAPSGKPAGTDGETTAAYFALYRAVAVRDKAAIATGVAALRAFGEGDWLDRL